MTFHVKLRNQLTGVERVVRVKSQYDATSVLATEAKRKMKLFDAWDFVYAVRVAPEDDYEHFNECWFDPTA